MTHQIFTDEEKVYGYRGLSMHLHFNATTLEALLSLSYSSKVDPETNDGVPADDIHAAFAEWMDPTGLTMDRDAFVERVAETRADAAGFAPPGEEMGGWTRESGIYTVHRANFATPGMRELHTRLRFLPILFIDAARYIDDTDPRWDVFTVWGRATPSDPPAVVGYATCYRFLAFPDKVRYRVSQFLILPPFQRQGHGIALLDAIHRYARESDDIVQVTVEDPAPGFVFIRDLLTLRTLHDKNLLDITSLRGDAPYTCPKDKAKEIGAALAIPPQQVVRAYEITRMVALGLDLATQGADVQAVEAAETAFRLALKQRLYKKHLHSPISLAQLMDDATPEMIEAAQVKEAEQRKTLLSSMFNDLLTHYGTVWSHAGIM